MFTGIRSMGIASGLAVVSVGFLVSENAVADDFRRPAYRGSYPGVYRHSDHHRDYGRYPGRSAYHHAPRPVYRPPAHVSGGYRPLPPVAYRPAYYKRPAYAYGCAPSYYTASVYVEPAYSYAPAYYDVPAPCYSPPVVVSRPIYYYTPAYRPVYRCGTGVSFGYYGSSGGFSFSYRR